MTRQESTAAQKSISVEEIPQAVLEEIRLEWPEASLTLDKVILDDTKTFRARTVTVLKTYEGTEKMFSGLTSEPQEVTGKFEIQEMYLICYTPSVNTITDVIRYQYIQKIP